MVLTATTPPVEPTVVAPTVPAPTVPTAPVIVPARRPKLEPEPEPTQPAEDKEIGS
jgi:hypothetical protein